MDDIQGDEHVIELDLGVTPDAGVSEAVLLQSEDSAVLFFAATAPSATRRCELGPFYDPAGTAVVTFQRLEESRFGGPNDEGRPEHPLYGMGMKEAPYAICEVLSSRWAAERIARNEVTARRIWGRNFENRIFFRKVDLRHFVFLFHDTTFECLAQDLRLEVSPESVGKLLVDHARRLGGE